MFKTNTYEFIEGVKMFEDGKKPPYNASESTKEGYTVQKQYQEGRAKCQTSK